MTTEIITASDVYWITRLDSLRTAISIAFAAASMITVFLVLLVGQDVFEFGNKEEAKKLRKPVLALCVLGMALVFVPSTSEAIIIKVIPAIANNADVQGLGSDVIKVAREWLESVRPK